MPDEPQEQPDTKSLFQQSQDRLREATLQTPQGEPLPRGVRVWQREAGKAQARKERQGERAGAVPPPDPNLSDGIEQGMKSPGFDSIRGSQDVNGAQATYQNQLVSTLTTMSRILMETTIRLEQLEQYFDRLR